jgi:D-amino-acid oxidase
VEALHPLVVEEGCGLRPARHGGIRLEVEWHEAVRRTGDRSDSDADTDKKVEKVVVVYHYGFVSVSLLSWKRMGVLMCVGSIRHGGYGFQSSWGSAGMALQLLKGALEKGEGAKLELNEAAKAKYVEGSDIAGNVKAASW